MQITQNVMQNTQSSMQTTQNSISELTNLIWEKLNTKDDKADIAEVIQSMVNTDNKNPINHVEWLNDYKTYGSFSYVYNDKTKLHEIYENLELCANDKMISGEALDYHILKGTPGDFLSNCYGLSDSNKETLINLKTFDNILNNEVFLTLLNLPLSLHALINSTEAFSRMVLNSNAMNFVANHDASLEYITTSQTALLKVINSSIALEKIWTSQKAVNAICASPIFFVLVDNQSTLASFGYAASNAGSAYSVWNGKKTFIANGKTIGCAYSGAIKNIILPNGTYTLKVYGAQGGTYASSSGTGGKGGYSTGNISISSPSTYYLVVGGQGSKLTATGTQAGGGYNGGGHATTTSSSYYTCGGGGASHIATVSGTLKALGASNLSKILIVGGGGGGAGRGAYNGGTGGGETGGAGAQYSSSYLGGAGGTQSAAGTSYYGTSAATTTNSDLGGFGFGASAKTSSTYSSGGGGGLYGGGSSRQGAGGGGSGYIGGVIGGSMTNGSRSGNGTISITRVGA